MRVRIQTEEMAKTEQIFSIFFIVDNGKQSQ